MLSGLAIAAGVGGRTLICWPPLPIGPYPSALIIPASWAITRPRLGGRSSLAISHFDVLLMGVQTEAWMSAVMEWRTGSDAEQPGVSEFGMFQDYGPPSLRGPLSRAELEGAED